MNRVKASGDSFRKPKRRAEGSAGSGYNNGTSRVKEFIIINFTRFLLQVCQGKPRTRWVSLYTDLGSVFKMGL